MRGEEVRLEDIIADNMATIAQGLTNKGNLAFPSTIYKLCKDAGVPLREFRRTPRIPELSYIMARRMETIRFPRNPPQPQHEDDVEDEPMPQADGGNEEEEEQQQPQQNQQPPQHGFPDFQPQYQSQFHETLQGIESHLSSMQFCSKPSTKTWRNLKRITWKKSSKSRQNNKRFGLITKGSNLNIDKSKRGLLRRFKSEIPITQIPDIMQTNAEKGRPMFYGCLKSDYGATFSSQVDPQEPVPLWPAPPSPGFHPPNPPPN
ncbi:hypothetical protein PIB30_073333 [Stylosanthes scabra]|uniref:Uncharacterized protein n=1 Tax=Stylosanthes scabra TaxID=79078 RepID=A0ABU6VMS9_9FABA|nr:hypothetical protein [Stylosanthes scabra]